MNNAMIEILVDLCFIAVRDDGDDHSTMTAPREECERIAASDAEYNAEFPVIEIVPVIVVVADETLISATKFDGTVIL